MSRYTLKDALLRREIPESRIQAADTYVDEDTKGNKPAHGDKEIKRPIDETRRERYEPYECHQDCYSGDDFRVYEAPEALGVLVRPGEDPARNASDDGREGELGGT